MTHLAPIFRTESGTWFQTNGELQTNNNYLEKRQLFLRSYQFSRKQSFSERLRRSLVRVKRILSGRVKSVRKLPKVVWSGLRFALYNKRRRLFKLLNHHHYYNNNSKNSSNFCKHFKYELFHRSNTISPSCFW
ncbi:Prolactin [Bienertia sinuspersici]